jgi:uncharacterized membrane protein YraQ (UPF0718 family)
MLEMLNNIWSVYLDTAFWLLIGLLAAGLVKAYIPADAMQRWLGGRGLPAIGRAALFGAPLPLCSCGVLPAALGIRRSGASKEATVSFLISTPETSIDSVAVTYALMGPVMAIYRPLAALVSAVVTGLMTALVNDDRPPVSSELPVVETKSGGCCSSQASVGSCSGGNEGASCCAAEAPAMGNTKPYWRALRFAGAELLDDIARWMLVGIVAAGIMITLLPPGWLAQWGQGLPAMLVMLVVGVPLYICATASTPIAAGLILAGVSPGTVLVFLLVGPATNIAGLILVKRELGLKVTVVYLTGIALVSVFMGLLLDAAIAYLSLDVQVSLGHAHATLPALLSWGSALLLLVLAVPPVRRRVFPFLQTG